MQTELSSGAFAKRRANRAGVHGPGSTESGRAWTVEVAAEPFDESTPFTARRTQRVAKGSARIRRTTLVFQALLIVAMVVAMATTLLGGGAGASVGTNSPSDPPPSVFIFPSD